MPIKQLFDPKETPEEAERRIRRTYALNKELKDDFGWDYKTQKNKKK